MSEAHFASEAAPPYGLLSVGSDDREPTGAVGTTVQGTISTESLYRLTGETTGR